MDSLSDDPFFVSTPIENAIANTLYSYVIDLSHSYGYDVSLTSVIPTWSTLNATTNDYQWILSGIPLNENIGDFDVVLVATSESQSITQSFTIQVMSDNFHPFFVSIPIENAVANTLYSYVIDLSHDHGYYVALTGVIPSWSTLNISDSYQWILSGIPLNEDIGEVHEVVIVATDGYRSTTQEYTIKVANDNIIIIDTGNIDVSQGSNINSVINISYTNASLTTDLDVNLLDISFESYPDWITITETSSPGQYSLSGQPLQQHVGVSNEIIITASHQHNVETKTIQINVLDVDDIPFIVTTPIGVSLYATQDVLFNHTIDVSDVDGVTSLDISYVVNGVLSEWLDFTVNSLSIDISGVPTNSFVGLSYEIFVSISYESVSDISQTYILNVISTPPYFASTPNYSCFVNEEYNYYVDVGHVDNDVVMTVCGENIPSWLNLTGSVSHSLHLTGRPVTSNIGLHYVVIAVSDLYTTVRQEFTINVTNVNDAAINFLLRGLDTDIDLYEKMEFKDISRTVIHHQYIARKQVVAASFDFVFWFRLEPYTYVSDVIASDSNDINSIGDGDISYAIVSERWNSAVDISYSDFVPDSGIDASYNVIREDISQYYDKNTLAELGVSRMARQVSGSYMNSYVFENRNELVQQYKDLDVSVNELIKSKLDNSGGSFAVPLSNNSFGDENITRNLMEIMLTSGTSSDRIREAVNEASGGIYNDEINTGDGEGVYPWVPLNFKPGDKLRHRLTYVVESIVNDYSNVDITDNINNISSNQYPDIIYGGTLSDMSNVVITDQHFLIEYEMV